VKCVLNGVSQHAASTGLAVLGGNGRWLAECWH